MGSVARQECLAAMKGGVMGCSAAFWKGGLVVGSVMVVVVFVAISVGVLLMREWRAEKRPEL